MATLILSTVGTALGGPVGGAIGALVGQSIDQQLLGSSRGPRVGDLKVQSSSYGTQIPRIYGTMRVAGTVIWATDLVESSEMSGAKGQPDTTYSYTVSLAVALSSRRLTGVGRIWADGKLLRGTGGDFKVSTKFRFHSGDEDQEVDPLIASAEGTANTTAYRGIAVAVFEDLDLGAYGNRIPFLTFEVVADAELTSVGQVLNDASGGLIASSDSQELGGYAAYGQTIKGALQPLVDSFAVELFDDGSRLVTPGSVVSEIADNELGCSSSNQKASRIQREQVAARSLPSALRLSYYDPALDYQSGEARASSADKRGTEEQRDLPAAVTATGAKSLVQQMIARAWAERDKLTLRLPPRYLGLQPGARVALDLSPGVWRVEQTTIDGYVVVADMRPGWTPGVSIAADPGRIVTNLDEPASDVALALFDVPDVLQQGSASPTMLLAASTASAAWKGHGVEVTAGQQTLQLQAAARKSILGRTIRAPGGGDPYLFNDDSSFEVELIDRDQWLVSCDDDALICAANLAVLGSEVLQFGRAEPLGPGIFRLSRLLRGRAGTEWTMDGHAIGEPFALIDRESLRPVPLPSWVTGAEVNASVLNVSGVATNASLVLSGESLRPPAPVNLQPIANADGSLTLTWTRRSRLGFAWIDGIDAPLGEATEAYRVTIGGAEGTLEFQTDQAALTLSAAELTAAGSGPLTIEVRQVGDASASRPGQATLTI